MIKIFPTEKVKILDQYTITHEPIASVDLVERAATLFVQQFVSRFSRHRKIYVFAGQGNNGADALAIARMLHEESYDVETYLINPSQRLSPDCEMNRERLMSLQNAVLHEAGHKFEPPVLREGDLVVDGLFGSGLNRPLQGGFAGVVKYINASGAYIVAIDIPSGLFGEDNRENQPDAIIQAKLTLTFGFPKLAFFLPENEPYVGEWALIDIGIDPDITAQTETPYALTTEEDVNRMLRPRPRFAHKGTFGHALLMAGSRGKLGASVLAAKACLRSGAGLLTVHIPRCGERVMQAAFPEAMLSLDSHDERLTSVPGLAGITAIGIGPGIGQADETKEMLEKVLRTANRPVVIDADALNLLAAHPEMLRLLPPGSILTPHPKEFDRLAGESAQAYERLHKAVAFAAEHAVTIVLKGAFTAVCTPDGKIRFNPNGNPGMATAGSGDVLTGVVLGLLAQGYAPEEAAVAGVYLHGLAGDQAAIAHSQESMLAGDIVEKLGTAFKLTR